MFIVPSDRALDDIAAQLVAEWPPLEGPGVEGGKWVALSALQKGIRRGNTSLASAAAKALYGPPGPLWQRLMVLALEDIGLANLALVEVVIRLAANSNWRKRHADQRALALSVTSALAGSIKSRTADELLMIAAADPELDHQRAFFVWALEDQLAGLMRGPGPLAQRALAAWFLAGTDRYWISHLSRRRGALPTLWRTYHEMGLQADWLDLLAMAATRIRWPLAILLPLARLATSEEPVSIEAAVVHSPTAGGLPSFVFDRYTRSGTAAINLYSRSCGPLARFLARLRPGVSRSRLLKGAVFAVEGSVCDRRWLTPSATQIRVQADAAELVAAGLPHALVPECLSLVRQTLPDLHEARLETLRWMNG